MKNLLIILLSVLSLTALAQTVPNWYDNDMRRAFYPAGVYYSGYAEGQRTSGESVEAATVRLKNAAKVEAVGTIRVHIQNTTVNQALSQTLRTMEGTFRQSARELQSTTVTKVDMEIPGLQIESWRNPQNGNIAAFAYVKKTMLIRQLEKKITVGLTKIETSLDQIEQLIQTGQKIQARELAKKTLPQFSDIEEAQKLLAAVDENADEESLQLQETRILQNRLTAIIAELKNGINIYLDCVAQTIGGGYPALKHEIEGRLSGIGCNFVSTPEESDWAVYVLSVAREYNVVDYGSSKAYFTYIEAKITIDKTTTGQRIYEDQIKQKGGHTMSYREAARDGYEQITPKIVEIINNQIKQ